MDMTLIPAEDNMTSSPSSPVAILDKAIANYPSYTIELFELCDHCGARFGIGYHQACVHPHAGEAGDEDLPTRLREMLARDHGHDRKHKQFREI